MSGMIFFTLIISGAFQIIRATGAIDSGIVALTKRVRGIEFIAIPILTACFSLFGCFMGSAEEMLPFYPIVISLCLALGFDTIVGVAVVLCGAGAGFADGTGFGGGSLAGGLAGGFGNEFDMPPAGAPMTGGTIGGGQPKAPNMDDAPF